MQMAPRANEPTWPLLISTPMLRRRQQQQRRLAGKKKVKMPKPSEGGRTSPRSGASCGHRGRADGVRE